MFRTSLLLSLFLVLFSFRISAQEVDAIEIEDTENPIEEATPVEAVTPPLSSETEKIVPPPVAEEVNLNPIPEKKPTVNNEATPITRKKSVTTSEFNPSSGNQGSVILESPTDYTLDYQHRRTRHGFVFGLTSESFYPVDYQSQFADGYIENIIAGDSIKLYGVELGYKYNFSVASVSALFSYGQGSADGSAAGSSLSLKKQALEVNLALDAVFREPWVVPYVQAGIHQFTINEERTTGSKSASADYAFNYRYGLLFQLDWIEAAIDKDAKFQRLQSSGLENTFIDVYYVDYLASSKAQDPTTLGSEGDPNLASSGEMGIGLKLEF